MQVSPRFLFSYPALTVWVRTNIPLVVGNNRVWTAFLRYGELSAAHAVWALTLAPTPILDYKVMPGANGEFAGAENPHIVYLAQAICDRYWNDRNDPRMHILLESTILHEIVHWGDWKDGVDHPLEEGKEFEKQAYGRDINRYW